MIKIKELAIEAGKSERTIQRWIESYNKNNNTFFPFGSNAIIEDLALVQFIRGKIKPKSEAIKPKIKALNTMSEQGKKSPKKTSKHLGKKTLQSRLSSDWLVMVVLFVLLWADVLSFSIIGHHEYSNLVWFSFIGFGIVGLACGIGSIVTFNRIKDKKLANIWKVVFGILQFFLFSLTINEYWRSAEFVMTSMFVLVFIGVQASIKNDE